MKNQQSEKIENRILAENGKDIDHKKAINELLRLKQELADIKAKYQ